MTAKQPSPTSTAAAAGPRNGARPACRRLVGNDVATGYDKLKANSSHAVGVSAVKATESSAEMGQPRLTRYWVVFPPAARERLEKLLTHLHLPCRSLVAGDLGATGTPRPKRAKLGAISLRAALSEKTILPAFSSPTARSATVIAYSVGF